MVKAVARSERKGRKVVKIAPRHFQPYGGSKASWRPNVKQQEIYTTSIRHGAGGSTDERMKPGLCFHAENRDTGGMSVKPGQAEIFLTMPFLASN